MTLIDGRRRRLKRASAGVLSLLFLGLATVPAYAASPRDRQWHLDAMQAEKMWEVSKGEGVTVAVIDTGVDSSVPGLEDQVLKGKDFSGLPGGAHDDYANHGTGMASLIAGDAEGASEQVPSGLAPGAKILPLRVDLGTGDADNQAEADERLSKQVGSAIRYAVEAGARIINISLASRGEPDFNGAIEFALSQNTVIFAGVGNEGDQNNPVMYPAAYPGVIGVAALDRQVEATEESQHGPQVDLSAPGDEMMQSCTGGTRLCMGHGTSAASAIASASAALIWAEHPDWTANQVTRVLVETAGNPDSGKERTDYVGYGAVRPRIALLEGPVDPGDPNTNPLPASPYYEGKASPSPKSPDGADDSASTDDQAAPVTDDAASGMSTGEWIAYGLLAAVVIAGAVATPIALARRKRNRPGPQAPAYAGPPMPTAPPGSWNTQQHQHGSGDYHQN